MDERPSQNAPDLPPNQDKPHIPPPVLTPHGPQTPPSPMDEVKRTAPPTTPENPEARVHLAHGGGSPLAASAVPMNSRILAGVIDMLVVIGISITLGAILPGIMAFILPGFLGFIPSLTSWLAWPVAIAYLLLRDSLPFLDGQSLGKKAMKIRAVTLDGESLVGKWEPALIRNAVLIPLFGLIELIVLLSREGKPESGRRLGDEWGKTKVILEPVTPTDVGTPPATL